MKGTRAKKAAEAAAAAESGGAPAAPASALKSGMASPAASNGSKIRIPEDQWVKIIDKIRTNRLMGSGAAEALEEAAGRKGSSPAAPAEAPKKKKTVGGFADSVDEIPDLEVNRSKPPAIVGMSSPRGGTKQRASFSEEVDSDDDAVGARPSGPKDAAEPPELNLNVKQNKMRTDLEMWVMDEVPALWGVDDSDELEDEDLQEDGQALKITQMIAEKKEDKRKALAESWLKDCPDQDAAAGFVSQLCEKVKAIQDAGPKKKR